MVLAQLSAGRRLQGCAYAAADYHRGRDTACGAQGSGGYAVDGQRQWQVGRNGGLVQAALLLHFQGWRVKLLLLLLLAPILLKFPRDLAWTASALTAHSSRPHCLPVLLVLHELTLQVQTPSP